jgi:hypothetical protein
VKDDVNETLEDLTSIRNDLTHHNLSEKGVRMALFEISFFVLLLLCFLFFGNFFFFFFFSFDFEKLTQKFKRLMLLTQRSTFSEGVTISEKMAQFCETQLFSLVSILDKMPPKPSDDVERMTDTVTQSLTQIEARILTSITDALAKSQEEQIAQLKSHAQALEQQIGQSKVDAEALAKSQEQLKSHAQALEQQIAQSKVDTKAQDEHIKSLAQALEQQSAQAAQAKVEQDQLIIQLKAEVIAQTKAKAEVEAKAQDPQLLRSLMHAMKEEFFPLTPPNQISESKSSTSSTGSKEE